MYIVGSDDGFTLIDCGGYDENKDFEWVFNQLQLHGVDYKKIKRIFLSHTHRDHALLAGKIAGCTDATVYLGAIDYLRMSGNIEKYRNYYRRVRDYLNNWGFREDMVTRFFRSFERQFYNARIPEDRIVFVDNEISVDGFDIIPTPGHTMGSLCFLLRDKGMLFTGDSLIKKIVTVPIIEFCGEMFTSSLTVHNNSIRKIKDIDFSLILPGHGEILKKDELIIDTIFTYIRRRAKRVLSLIREGNNNVYDVSMSLYGKDVLYEVVNHEGPMVYVSDLMMPLEYLYIQNEITVIDGKITAI